MSLLGFVNKSLELPTEETAILNRPSGLIVEENHFISGNRIIEPVPSLEKAVFGMGCFWGAERLFWTLKGVYSTAVGYAGGITVNPTYDDVCSGRTGHTEAVLTFSTHRRFLRGFTKVFWESHNPTEGMRQGNDVGTQYRSAIYCDTDEQLLNAKNESRSVSKRIRYEKLPSITTEIKVLNHFYYAETYHQQYLGKNPNGYCGLMVPVVLTSRLEIKSSRNYLI